MPFCIETPFCINEWVAYCTFSFLLPSLFNIQRWQFGQIFAAAGICRQVRVRHKIRAGLMLRKKKKNKKEGTAGAELVRKGVKVGRNLLDLDYSNMWLFKYSQRSSSTVWEYKCSKNERLSIHEVETGELLNKLQRFPLSLTEILASKLVSKKVILIALLLYLIWQ